MKILFTMYRNDYCIPILGVSLYVFLITANASVSNPVVPDNMPDPHVLRDIAPDGRPVYYLTASVGTSGDIPVYQSRDLKHWFQATRGLFGRSAAVPGGSIEINGKHFCQILAPQIVKTPTNYMLTFTAHQYAQPKTVCPINEPGSVFVAYSNWAAGPYAPPNQPQQPLPAGPRADCDPAIRAVVPHSSRLVSHDCQGGGCIDMIRLDSEVFQDTQTQQWWMAYSWVTNFRNISPWERANFGHHVAIVELAPEDNYMVKCSASVKKVFAGNPHHRPTLTALSQSCPRCGELLSMTRGRFGQVMTSPKGDPFGINEGSILFRRGGYVYLLMNGSFWDSGYYHYFWVAAPTVEQLHFENPQRLAGRLLVPSQDHAFGHGSVVLGPEGLNYYLVHHHLDANACRSYGICDRDVWLTQLAFEDRGDGRGAVYLRAEFPAEQHMPRGYHEFAHATSTSGWTCDPNKWDHPLKVSLYEKKGAVFNLLADVPANILREPGVGGVCGGQRRHGFEWRYPDYLRDGLVHDIVAYAENVDDRGIAIGGDPFLAQTPQRPVIPWILHLDLHHFQLGTTPATATIQYRPDVFNASPLVFTSLQSYSGPDPVDTRISHTNLNSFQVRLEEEQSADTETRHVPEKIAAMGIENVILKNTAGAVVGETGQIVRSQVNGVFLQGFNLKREYVDPVAILQTQTRHGTQPVHVRLVNPLPHAIVFQLEEWDYLDGGHVSESIAYMVMERGIHLLPEGVRIEAGRRTADHRWSRVDFSSGFFPSTPAVFSQAQSYNGNQAVVARQDTVSKTGFRVFLQEEERNLLHSPGHKAESLGYIAIHQSR